MIKIYKYSLGQLQANCYFLINNQDCLIIDPGDEASFILEEIQRRRLNLLGLLGTHGHFDHMMAVGEIQKSFNIPYYIFEEDQFLIDRVNETTEHFLGYKQIVIKPITVKYLTEKKYQISNIKYQILRTPGHTPGGCCVYLKKEKTIFTGDTLFRDGIGRYDFSYCNKTDLKNSLKKILKLPEKTVIYPGHGEKTTIKEEKNNLLHYINIL